MDSTLIAYYIGISIILITHIYILVFKKSMDGMTSQTHAILNILAAAMIAYYFLSKEKIIKM